MHGKDIEPTTIIVKIDAPTDTTNGLNIGDLFEDQRYPQKNAQAIIFDLGANHFIFQRSIAV